MAANYDTAQTPTIPQADPANSPWAAGTFTPASGSNRLALIIVGIGNGSGNGGPTNATAVTLGGQSMTQAGSSVTDGNFLGVSAWYLKESGIAAMSGAAISATLGLGNVEQIGAVCFTLTGVDQTTPISSPQTGSGSSATAQAAAVTSTSGGLVVSGLMSDSQGGVTASGSDDGGTMKTTVIGADTICAAQYTAGTGGSIQLSWTQTATGWAALAFNVNAAGGNSSSMSPSVSPSSSVSPSPSRSLSPSASQSPSASVSPSPAPFLIIQRTVIDYVD